MNRRDFLKFAGIAPATAAVSTLVPEEVEAAAPTEWTITTVEVQEFVEVEHQDGFKHYLYSCQPHISSRAHVGTDVEIRDRRTGKALGGVTKYVRDTRNLDAEITLYNQDAKKDTRDYYKPVTLTMRDVGLWSLLDDRWLD